MEILTHLPQEDMDLLREYINYYGGSSESSSYMAPEAIPYFLRYWSRYKAPFYSMFGNQFIIRKEVSFTKDEDIMEEEMESAMRRDDLIWEFKRAYNAKVDSLYDIPYDERYEIKRFANDTNLLVTNEYNGDPFCIPAKYTIDNRPLQINKGVKVVKMLGKICRALGVSIARYKCPTCNHYFRTKTERCEWCAHSEEQELKDGYETFRQAHSLVLNQKKLKGNLCLSIHPLDFLTMSDNACGWGSCMSWMEEDGGGDYRLGTIECMNSPYIVVAYVESREPMEFGNGKQWNSKRWRQLLVVTPEMILGNKQYPYFNDELQGTAMNWMRELANASDVPCEDCYQKRFGPYESEYLQITNHRHNVVGNRTISVTFEFNYMYNDIYDHRLACIASNFNENSIVYNLSGPAVCTNCGEVIDKWDDEVDPSWTVCRACCGCWKCSCCGDWQYGDAYYAEDSDNPMCSYCYRNETVQCEVCGDRVMHTENIFIEVLPAATEDTETYNWNFVVDACSNCVHSRDFEELFGKLELRRDMFGRMREVILLENITDEGFELGELSPSAREMLKQLQKMDCYEDRVSLLQKNLY